MSGEWAGALNCWCFGLICWMGEEEGERGGGRLRGRSDGMQWEQIPSIFSLGFLTSKRGKGRVGGNGREKGEGCSVITSE